MFSHFPLQESTHLEQLSKGRDQAVTELKQAVSRAVPRPEPSQYAELASEVASFASNFCSIHRIEAMLVGLSPPPPAGSVRRAHTIPSHQFVQEAMTWYVAQDLTTMYLLCCLMFLNPDPYSPFLSLGKPALALGHVALACSTIGTWTFCSPCSWPWMRSGMA